MKNICIYCSSSDSIDPVFFETARELASRMASKQYNLVFGAGCVGLMGELAKTIHKFGGKVTGVIPQRLKEMGVCYENCDELIITDNMRERKHAMDEKSDAFIALPGGFGTLEEITEMITGKQLGFHNKPLVFMNTNGFYTPLLEFFEHIYQYKFSKPDFKEIYFVTESPEEALEYIENYKPFKPLDKWFSANK